MLILLRGLSAAAAWMLPLFVLGYAPGAVLFHGLGAGGLLAGALWALKLADLPQLGRTHYPDAEPAPEPSSGSG